METHLEDAPVLVTGASNGIGAAIAVAFARERARVALTYRSDPAGAERTADLVRRAGGEPLVVRWALEEPETAPAVIERVRERFGGLSALVNNAVYWPRAFKTMDELELDDFRTPVHANLDGTFAMIRAALPLIRRAPWGRIVTISTGLAVDGFPGSIAYMTGKAALHGLHRTLAKELGPAGILANVLMSGAVATRERPASFVRQLEQSAVTGRLTDADEVARAAVFLASPANGHVSGEAIRCDGFFVTAARRG